MSTKHSPRPDGAEGVLPYGADGSAPKTPQVESMFDHIAPAYDLMNRAMTFGLCAVWRDAALHSISERLSGADVLDVATGTGDVALRIATRHSPRSVRGADLSEGMLRKARERLASLDADHCPVEFDKADCLALPYADASFDVVTVAYGVRNFSRLDTGLAELRRVLRPGGALCVVELAEPRGALMRAGYRLYSRHMIPALGSLISGDRAAYAYLPRSIAAAPQRDAMAARLLGAGFRSARWRDLFPGTVVVYTAER